MTSLADAHSASSRTRARVLAPTVSGRRRARGIAWLATVAGAAVIGTAIGVAAPSTAAAAVVTATPIAGFLHTNGTDSSLYDASGHLVRLVGVNWTGTEGGGRADARKTTDACGAIWRTPADSIPGLVINYDNMYQVLHDWGFNVLRVPVSWNDLEPTAPVWNATTLSYTHTWNTAYLDDLRSMVHKARQNGLAVILDMHQDYWSPALHNITNWDGSKGYCEGVGLPRWLYPTMDAKTATVQTTDFYNGMNWFYRNTHDPRATVTHQTPWQLLYAAWDQLSYQFSANSGFADATAVIGADILNEPYGNYVGGNPATGQTVLQAADSRLRSFYTALGPAITHWSPNWLLIFQDSTGGYNTANPAARETPVLTARPSGAGNWVYSMHDYNFGYGVFNDGTSHDDYGIRVAAADLANARAWHVPLYVGEFTAFTKGVDVRQLTTAGLAETRKFVDWAKTNEVSHTFWAYVNPYRPMMIVEYTTNQVVPLVQATLAAGL